MNVTPLLKYNSLLIGTPPYLYYALNTQGIHPVLCAE